MGNEFPNYDYKSRKQKQYIWLLFPAFLFADLQVFSKSWSVYALNFNYFSTKPVSIIMRFLAFIFFCCTVNIILAQIDTTEIYDLVPVTIQATRFATEDIKSPLATTSLAKSFIQRGQNIFI